MKNDGVIRKYNSLLNQNLEGKSSSLEQQIIDLLEDYLLQNDIPDNLKVWAYWNISDNYALQRNHQNTYQNHLKFESYVRTLAPNYMLMLICDTTQRLSLIESGNAKYWSNLYYEIINSLLINDTNYCIAFEVLRTALYPLAMSADLQLVDHALAKMKDLVTKYSNDTQRLRFKILFYCSLLSYNYLKAKDVEAILIKSYDIFMELKSHLKDIKDKDESLFGTYESWNKKRSLWHQARSLYDYIITLINTENYELAYKCYREIGEEEFTNKYFKKKIALLKEKLNICD